MNVYATDAVVEYFKELVDILYEKGYFSYTYASEIYATELFDDIITNLSKKRHKPAPPYYDRYGKGIRQLTDASFTKNKRTTWYAFFNKYEENGETIYLVRYIGNNHTEAHHLYED
jgi:hypothetical protein